MRLRHLLVLSVLSVCTACTGTPWHKEFWTLPPASGAAPIKGQSYPMQRATGTDHAWPNLGDVPERPPAPLTPDEIIAQQRALELARSKSAVIVAEPNAATTTSSKNAKIVVPAQPPEIPPELTGE